MRPLNQKGQVIIFFVLVVPVLVLMLVTTVEFSKIVFTKMKLQGAVDRGVYAGASYLTEVLNKIALLNWDAHQNFLNLKNYFRTNSKPSNEEATRQIKDHRRVLNEIWDQMDSLNKEAYRKAYEIANEVARKDFPEAPLIFLYRAEPLLLDGPMVDFAHDRINGTVVFDPTGHEKVSKSEWQALMGFFKDPSTTFAFAAGTEAAQLKPNLAFLELARPLRAVAAAQPFGGSVWNFALNPQKTDEDFLYRTAMVPLETLPSEGFKDFMQNKNNWKDWEDFEPNEVHH